ncbi:uncharacterized protein LOC142344290 [Convolutriloba macropyga]|uniref:uncharacterized protein LOC142344290 n=1 Tax=Convolutriloba macropyga TaxID=536237 RepID=UPI003F52129C
MINCQRYCSWALVLSAAVVLCKVPEKAKCTTTSDCDYANWCDRGFCTMGCDETHPCVHEYRQKVCNLVEHRCADCYMYSNIRQCYSYQTCQPDGTCKPITRPRKRRAILGR